MVLHSLHPHALLAGFFNLGGWELLVLALIALLLFGKRLPDVARSVGKSVTEFKKGLNEVTAEVREPADPANSPTRLPSGDANAVARGQTQDAGKA